MYYIQETDKPCSLAKIFNKIETKDNKIILPIIEEKLKLEKAEKLGKKTIKLQYSSNKQKNKKAERLYKLFT